jgi:CspA family cold shock protein
METGTVKFFNDAKGYGFISRHGHADLFVHFSSIEDQAGFRSLQEGQEVEFKEIAGKRGPEAASVRIIRY